MLEYDRIGISEGIDIDRTNKSKECKICHYWYLVVMVYLKKLLVLIILQLFMLKEMLTELTFGI